MGWIQGLDRRHGRLLTVAVGVILVTWASYLAATAHTWTDAGYADSTADLLVATAVSDGLSPYQDLRRLGEVYDIPYRATITPSPGEVLIHPRTPAAILFLQPLIVGDAESALRATHIATLASVVVMGVWLIPRLTGVPRWLGMAVGAVVLFSGPVVRANQFGSISPMLVLLIGWTWVMARRRDSFAAGLPLGLAIALRLSPLILLVPLLIYGRRKASASAVLVGFVANLLGMALFDLALGEAVGALGATSAVWVGHSANGSLVGPLSRWMGILPAVSLLCIFTGCLVLLLRPVFEDLDWAYGLAVVGMLLASPLAWEHYDVVLLLVAVFVVVAGSGIDRWLASFVFIIATAGYYLRQPFEDPGPVTSGGIALTVRVLMLGAILAGAAAVAIKPRRVGT
jgi:hypothetical protein